MLGGPGTAALGGAPSLQRQPTETPAVRRESLYQRVRSGESLVFAVCGLDGVAVCRREVGPAQLAAALRARGARWLSGTRRGAAPGC
jgi:hypothetical protein